MTNCRFLYLTQISVLILSSLVALSSQHMAAEKLGGAGPPFSTRTFNQ